MRHFQIVMLAAWLGAAISAHAQSVVTIDTTQRFQEITGMGAFGKLSAACDPSVHYDDIAFDAGFNVIRHEISPYCQLSEGEPFNIDAFVFGGPSVRDNFINIKALHARGVEVFIGTVWSPPGWMKDNNLTRFGGHLLRSRYDDFADYLITYIQRCKDISGVELYAISLQNELEWAQPFNSCVYEPQDLADLIKVVKPRFQQAGLQTKIFFPEHMADLGRNSRYIDGVLNDSEAQPLADIVAVHGYMLDGASPDSPDAQNWQTLFGKGDAYGKPLWMTETSGYAWRNWNDVMKLGRAMYTAFTHGQISAWVWWAFDDPTSGDPDNERYAISYDCQRTPLYDVHKQFSRFVPPGSRRIDAQTSASNLHAVAFEHTDLDIRTVVLVNDAEQRTVSLNGLSASDQMRLFVTSNGASCEDQGVVGQSDITLPRYSVSTLTNTVRDLRGAHPPAAYDIDISAPNWLVSAGGSLQLNAQVVDQYGESIASAHTLTWSCNEGGTLSATQGATTSFSASTPGAYLLVATAGDMSAERLVTVFDRDSVHLKINCGGLPFGDWVSDKNYAEGGMLFYFDTPQDISHVQDPAPGEVYQTVRHTDHSYNIGLPDGDYTVRLHFTDHYGGRTFGYTMEGEVVLENFDVETAAGSLDRAVTREFEVTVADQNGLQIECSRGTSNDVFECAIEIQGVATGTGRLAGPSATQHRPASISTHQAPGGTLHITARQAPAGSRIEIADISGRIVHSYVVSDANQTHVWDPGRTGLLLIRLTTTTGETRVHGHITLH